MTTSLALKQTPVVQALAPLRSVDALQPVLDAARELARRFEDLSDEALGTRRSSFRIARAAALTALDMLEALRAR
jgi:hypothetical protein